MSDQTPTDGPPSENEPPTYTPPPPPPDPQPTYTPPPRRRHRIRSRPTNRRRHPRRRLRRRLLRLPTRSRWTRGRMTAMAIFGVVALIGALLFFLGRGDSAAAGEIFLEGSDVPGTATFTPSIAAAPAAAPTTPTTVAVAPSSGPTRANAAAPGLYAGQRDVPSCNAGALITYLEANPGRAAPWAGALGIATADIRAFVNTLTPALLTVDTRVTDYGLADGRAVPRQSILESGTAVLLDRTLFPRVRCVSGNPLGEPQAVTSSPDYTGTRWPGFSPGTVIVINPAPATTVIVLIDILTGIPFVRIPGSIIIIDIDRPPDGNRSSSSSSPAAPLASPAPTGRRARSSPSTSTTRPSSSPTRTADGAGNIAADVRIPDTAAPGVHTVTITGGGFTVTQPVYVIPRAPTARVRPA